MDRPIIALDADNVLLDYSLAYADAWARAFGERPIEQDPLAYWPMHRWGVARLSGDRLERFRSCFDEAFWSTLPAVSGALEACKDLQAASFELVCVSALEAQFEASRLENLRALGFPIERVVATGSASGSVSPKADALRRLNPVAFVDDYLPYFRGVSDEIHRALVLRHPNGSPNAGPELALVDSHHADLAAFARWWLARHAHEAQA